MPLSDRPLASSAENPRLAAMRQLSPRRHSSQATTADELVAEQLAHFGIDRASDFGERLAEFVRVLYEARPSVQRLAQLVAETASSLDRTDRVAHLAALKFLSFQVAKLLDDLQGPTKRLYQALDYSGSTLTAKGPYAVFDNVTAIFSANPVITRTATYVYACAEWIAEAFQGRELLLEIYSRLLNPTSIALANHIVDVEAGPYARDYLAWNFSSGMAAIDTTLAHLLGHEDILITSRGVYGGTHQLLHDWYAKPGNLAIAVEAFDGFTVADFERTWQQVQTQYAARLAAGRRAYVYLESPSNPHGYVLDVPGICRAAHAAGLRVMLDATVGTPFLSRPLRRDDPLERPDFVIHSYTKDLSGGGVVIAGVVIGRNEDMFLPKHHEQALQTMFWNVYYVKGAFLNADAAFDVLAGIRSLEPRMLAKCINTLVLAKLLAAHPAIEVHCGALADDPNAALLAERSFLGLPAPLFTFDMPGVPREAFQRFFDALAPTFDHMISLGQSNTIVSCPALTTHSELDAEALAEAAITPTTIRVAVGDESPVDLVRHLVAAAELTIDPVVPGFSAKFASLGQVATLVRETYLDVHRRYIEAKTEQ